MSLSTLIVKTFQFTVCFFSMLAIFELFSCVDKTSGPKPAATVSNLIQLSTDTVFVGHHYTRALPDTCDHPVVSILEGPDSLYVNQGFLSWMPSAGDTGLARILLRSVCSTGDTDSIAIDVYVKTFWPSGCPSYTHKEDAVIKSSAILPDGFFVYDRDSLPGLYRSPIRKYRSSLIPNTAYDYPRTISISDDGQWVLYVNSKRSKVYLIGIDGCGKTLVPVVVSDVSFPTIAGFIRNGPYGCEVFYLAGYNQMRAVKVDLSGDTPVFGNDRCIASVGTTLSFRKEADIQAAVVKDQIFGLVGPIVNGSYRPRTGYLTIPEQGYGIADSTCIYKWRNDDYQVADGCGHTMSFDGDYALANAGGVFGFDCIPGGSHKGFYITPFRRVSDPPMLLYTEHINVNGTSINWCPKEYRTGDQNFWGWSFSNINDYVAGRMISVKSESCAWIVGWRENTWHPITPLDSNIHILQPAAFFVAIGPGSPFSRQLCFDSTSADTATTGLDTAGPGYRIIRPNGREFWHINEVCTIQVSSLRAGRGSLKLVLDSGIVQIPLPGLNHSINPQIDSIITFTMPESLSIDGVRYSASNTGCLVRIEDYAQPARYFDESDTYFTISR